MASESNVQSRVRLHAALAGWLLWRNNIGAGKLDNGSFVRWGLCNESAIMNRRFKSGDLIGGRPVVITPDMVGQTILQFTSVECKHDTWRMPANPDDNLAAQIRWRDLVNGAGGVAVIVSGPEQLPT